VVLAQAFLFATFAASAQSVQDTGPAETLHVSTSLIEIPLLIRNSRGALPIPSLPTGSIEVKLGDGAWLRPNFVRQEGQDPIDLAILLDQNSPVSDLPRPLTQALSSLSSLTLTSADHVSLFVMDCSSVRVTSVPADPAQVSNTIMSAISPPGQSGKHTCKEGGRLWDTLAVVTRTLQQSPRRRVILAITEGKDHGSVLTQKDLVDRAQSSAVAIFHLDPVNNSFGLQVNQGLPLIAQSSGGLSLGVEQGSLRQTVQLAITMLRGRYIVQLRVPSDAQAGHLRLAARVTELTSERFTVRITGNSAPLPNPGQVVNAPPQVAKSDTAPKAEAPKPATTTPTTAVLVQDQSGQHQVLSTSQEASMQIVPAQITQPSPSGPEAAPPSSALTTTVPTLKVNTRLTLVDVTVTDSKGHPVHGLTQADFTIKEDGKPQPIKNFEALGKDKPTMLAAAPPLPPDVYSNQQTSQPTTQAVNILLFDQVSTGISRGLLPSPEALKLFQHAATQFLKTMPVGKQVAVMTTDASGLHMLQGFTSDKNLLVAAVNSIPYQLVPEARWDPAPFPPPCNAMNFQSAQALNALNQTAAFVSSIPGRKNLIWFTPGIGWLTNYQFFSRFKALVCVTDFTPQLQQVYGRLTAARVALYPIDPRGLYNNPSMEAVQSGPPSLRSELGFSLNAFLDTGSLDDMAKATGGKAHYSNNGLEDFLRDDVSIGSDYYALSYVPPLSKYDGRYHKIEVKVDRPGVQLEYRRGYTSLDIDGPLRTPAKASNKSPETAQPPDPFHAAMDFGGPAATQIVFAVRALPSTDPAKPGAIGSLNPDLKGKPLVRYSFAFDLPRDKITLETQPDGSRKASFELAVSAYDVQGRRLNSLEEKRSVTLRPDAVAAFLQKPFLVPMDIDLPPGALSVRAGVLDLPSQQMGIVEIPLNVSK